MEESESLLAPIKQGKKFQKVCEAVRAGNSVLVLGEAGTGKGDFAKALFSEMVGEFNCAIATTLLIFGIWIADNGGIFQNLGQNLSLESAVVKVYNQNASTNHIYAEIEGFWESDRSKADGRYLILGNEGKEFIVTDGKGVYKTGTQIITSKVKTIIGSKSANIIQTLSFNDEQATPQLNQLKEKYPANLIVITGEVTIDLPDKIANYATNQKRFKLSSNRLTFNNCLLENAIAVLDGQYAIGSVEVTIINPLHSFN